MNDKADASRYDETVRFRLFQGFIAMLPLLFAGCSDSFAARERVTVAASSVQRLEVVDFVHGCFGGSDKSAVFELKGEVLTNGTDRIPQWLALQTMNVLITSEGLDFDPRLAGLTPERIEKERDALLARFVTNMPSGVLPDDIQEFFQWKPVVERAKRYIRQEVWSSNRVEMTFTFAGNPSVVAHSTSISGWRMPWAITVGDQSWVTYSPKVPLALREVVQHYTTDRHALTDDWADAFFRDPFAWSEVSDHVKHTVTRQRLEHLPGAMEGLSRFSLQERTHPNYLQTGMGLDMLLDVTCSPKTSA